MAPIPNAYEHLLFCAAPKGFRRHGALGDSFTLRDLGAQITITKVAWGNYGIRRIN
jgi:hypothetical protein